MRSQKNEIAFLLILLLSSVFTAQAQNASPAAVDLRCEYLKDPLGIDITQPDLSWKIKEPAGSTQKNIRQTAYRVLVASSPELLKKDVGDIWDSKKVVSDNSTHVIFGKNSEGKAAGILQSEMRCYWKVKLWTVSDQGRETASGWSQPALWTMGLLNENNWKAKWIGLSGDDEIKDTVTEHRRLAARMLRKEFGVPKKIKQAVAYVCGVGFFDLYVNGKLASDQLLNPALTGYTHRLLYVTFDVTRQLKQGNNALGVMLGNGRFFAPRKKVPVYMHNYGYPRLLLQLHITYDNGTVETVVSDESWKATSQGPVRANNEYDGEEYDARMEMPGWAAAGFNDQQWQKAQLMESPGGKLEAQVMEPIRITEVLRPKRILQPKPGIWMVDFGQSFYGSVRIKVKGKKGTEVKMHSSFNVLPDGTLKYQNDRSALNTDIYTLKGEGLETWHPRFKGNATRWVQV
ncbi:MAG: family 78 glycoside hydrolase catalytic domain, partial [Agriterribacter sp.]